MKKKHHLSKLISYNKTEYFNVYEKHGITKRGEYTTFYEYCKMINGVKYKGKYDTAKEAARQLDLKLISLGISPINILKRTANEREIHNS